MALEQHLAIADAAHEGRFVRADEDHAGPVGQQASSATSARGLEFDGQSTASFNTIRAGNPVSRT
ncbi:hypothetical protein EN829_001740 [Mesorhizobium sp. M00.F.Ca.ET.186.01.1.1]|nr:hypothetical protein EN829_001740 [Mesorhizobium sp. M00.F.Ca.ET.186.01.1.1]